MAAFFVCKNTAALIHLQDNFFTLRKFLTYYIISIFL